MHGLPPNSYKLIGSNNQVSTDGGTNVLHLQTLCRIIVFVSLVYLFAARATQAARVRSTYRPSWASRRECSTSSGQLVALALPNLQAKVPTYLNGLRRCVGPVFADLAVVVDTEVIMVVFFTILTSTSTQVSDMPDPPLITSHSYGDTEQGASSSA